MSDEVSVNVLDNGHAIVTLFGGTVTLNPAQLENLRTALLPPQVETPEKPAPKPTRKTTRKKDDESVSND